jgi:xanthine/uracil permease
MVLNIALLLLVFGAEKKKVMSAYVAAALLGLIKFILYALLSGTLIIPVLIGVVYGGLACAFVFFLKRLEQSEDKERPAVPTYSLAGTEKTRFRWEYIPLAFLLMLIVGGEVLLR